MRTQAPLTTLMRGATLIMRFQAITQIVLTIAEDKRTKPGCANFATHLESTLRPFCPHMLETLAKFVKSGIGMVIMVSRKPGGR